MKLIGFFVLLLFISSVFAAKRGSCARRMPKSTLKTCTVVPKYCAFDYVRAHVSNIEAEAYRSCYDQVDAGVDCKKLTAMDVCLSHQCSFLKVSMSASQNVTKCLDKLPDFFHWTAQPPRAIVPL